tara:strand:+ start:2250 stop:3383 length:1134 start_codon:yes stop_codon:yes gene_type:complete
MSQQIKSDSNFIPVFEPFIDFEDKWNVYKAISRKNISGSANIVSLFENEFANLHHREFGVAVSNGSVALDLAFASLELEKGDEVIIPSHTIISCLASVVRNKGTPVFCDVDNKSWNMSLEEIKKVVSNKTKAILMVHTFGLACEATEIENYCKENDIILIEDAAEAHGQQVNKKKCGSFGLMSTFSFYANKHVTTGEGGMLLTNSETVFKKISQMKNLDFTKKRFQHDNLYWNYRLGGLQAALGLSQIKKLDKTILKKMNQGKVYYELLSKYSNLIELQPLEYRGIKNHYWVFGVLLRKAGIRDSVIEKLLLEGIETRPFFFPLHLQNALPPEYRDENKELGVSEFLGNNGLYLPMGNHINKNKQHLIVNKLIEIIN